MDFEAENAKEWAPTGDETEQGKDGLPFRVRIPKPPNPATGGFKRADPKNASKTVVVRDTRSMSDQDDGAQINEWNRFALSHDTAAKDAWRRRRAPDASFRVPQNCGVIYESLRSLNKKSKRSNKTFSLQAYLDQIGWETGAFIELPGRADARLLNIWGSAAQVTAAKQELQALVNRHREQHPDWAKIQKVSEKMLHHMDRKMAEEAERQSYRRNPPEDVLFQYQGVFMWPRNRFPATVLLGNNLEAFDPVRTDNRCFIMWIPDESQVRVYTSRADYMYLALHRIQMTLREIVVRSLPATRIYMIEPIHPTAVLREVKLVSRKAAIKGTPVEDASVVPRLTGSAPSKDELDSWLPLQPRFPANNRKCFDKCVKTTLDRMRHFRGHLRMRVHFGGMSLRAYKRPGDENHSLDEFFDMLRNPQTVGEVARELNQSPEDTNVISCCRQAINLLNPIDPVTQSLGDVQPEYSASFEVRTLDTAYSARLEVNFARRAGEEGFDISAVRWLKKGQKGSVPDANNEARREKVPLTLITMDLERNSAWELAITCRTILDESHVTASMRNFVDTISLKVPAGGNTADQANMGDASVTFRGTEVHIESYVLNTHWRYLLKASTYVVEVTKEQHTVFTQGPKASATPAPASSTAGVAAAAAAVATATASPSISAARKINWKAALFNLAWDSILEKQSYLKIGEAGPWDAKLATFFPVEGGLGALNVGANADGVDGEARSAAVEDDEDDEDDDDKKKRKAGTQDDGVAQFLAKVKLVSRLVEPKPGNAVESNGTGTAKLLD